MEILIQVGTRHEHATDTPLTSIFIVLQATMALAFCFMAVINKLLARCSMSVSILGRVDLSSEAEKSSILDLSIRRR